MHSTAHQIQVQKLHMTILVTLMLGQLCKGCFLYDDIHVIQEKTFRTFFIFCTFCTFCKFCKFLHFVHFVNLLNLQILQTTQTLQI